MARKAGAKSKGRILVVEDHAGTARGLKSYLELCGYEVDVAVNSASAEQYAKTTAFDVLLCDLNLPDGTGWDLMARLRKRRPVPGIAFSAYNEPEHIARSTAVGFAEHVVKGTAPEALEATIARIMPKKKA